MRIVRTVIATCAFVGLGGAAAIAGAGSGSGSAKPAAMEMPKPPAELGDLQKKMVGTWKCTGKAMGGDMQMHDTAGNLQWSVDLDKWWSKASLTQTGTKTPFKFEAFTTYDAAQKKWVEITIDNMGGYGMMMSDGPKDNVASWTGTMSSMGHAVPSKSVRTMVSDKDVKIEDSMSTDNGKTWTSSVSVECKK